MPTGTRTRKQGTGALALLTLLAAWLVGCADDDKPRKGDPGGATETNVAPALCKSDEDCPPGIECAIFDGGGADAGGFCDVNEMEVQPGSGAPVSSAAPAPCKDDDDCPAGIDCKGLNGPGSVGFCDVVEMQAP